MTVKTFILHDDAAVHRMVAYLRTHRKPAAESGHPLQCTIAPFHPTAHNAQRRELWGYIIKPTSEQARVGGVQWVPDAWYALLKEQFLPDECAKGVPKWRDLPNGGRELAMGFGDLNEREADTFLLECRAYVTQELGVELPERPASAQRQPGAASSPP